jgi:hypothetical protein
VPAAYPTSCSPQAWAAASPLLWLRTLLRLDPWAPARQLWVSPRLPERITRLQATGITIGGRRVTITAIGDELEITGLDGYEVVTAPRPPLTSLPDPA